MSDTAPAGLEFLGEAGEILFSNSVGTALLAFIDDTGHETFADPQFPVFGLGGCAVLSGEYDKTLRTPWRTFKAQYCGGVEVRLHAAEFAAAFPQAVAPLASFFRSAQFFRFAVTATSRTQLLSTEIVGHGPGRSAPVYEQVTIVLRLRLKEIIENSGQRIDELVIIQEASERGDRLADRYFRDFVVAPPYQHLPVHLLRGTKALGEPGLEVADFIAHTAGAQARRRLEGAGWGRDFDSVFRTPARRLTSYLHLDSVKRMMKDDDAGA